MIGRDQHETWVQMFRVCVLDSYNDSHFDRFDFHVTDSEKQNFSSGITLEVTGPLPGIHLGLGFRTFLTWISCTSYRCGFTADPGRLTIDKLNTEKLKRKKKRKNASIFALVALWPNDLSKVVIYLSTDEEEK